MGMNFLNDLNKEELIRLITEYDNYIIEHDEDLVDGWYPVCIAEFYDNEYQDILESEEE